ncbi:unnamed protein product [Prorocentrum cordatum]|uniref:Uncharacterized protein n=1 Tax=Prorocentrum cordatum TaxID=2364126 RepID=A0ABN9X512_9DINO|nr:unnamed protein product [Polarella glacialis]
MYRKLQSVNERTSAQGITIHDLVERLGHLEEQLDLARAHPRLPVERSASWDREVDRAILVINSKEEVPFSGVEGAIGSWLRLSRRFMFRFKGDLDATVEHRVRHAFSALRDDRGTWQRFSVDLPLGRTVQLFVGLDEKRHAQAREMAVKRAVRALSEHLGVRVFVDRDAGIIGHQWGPLVSLQMDPVEAPPHALEQCETGRFAHGQGPPGRPGQKPFPASFGRVGWATRSRARTRCASRRGAASPSATSPKVFLVLKSAAVLPPSFLSTCPMHSRLVASVKSVDGCWRRLVAIASLASLSCAGVPIIMALLTLIFFGPVTWHVPSGSLSSTTRCVSLRPSPGTSISPTRGRFARRLFLARPPPPEPLAPANPVGFYGPVVFPVGHYSFG